MAQLDLVVHLPSTNRDRERIKKWIPGLQAYAAKRTHLSESHVCKVFNSKARSRRVERALKMGIIRHVAFGWFYAPYTDIHALRMLADLHIEVPIAGLITSRGKGGVTGGK